MFSAEGAQASAASPQSTEADDRAHPEDHPQTGMCDPQGGHFTYNLTGVLHGDCSFGGNKCCNILISRGNMC